MPLQSLGQSMSWLDGKNARPIKNVRYNSIGTGSLGHVGGRHNLSAHSSAWTAFQAQSVLAAYLAVLPRLPSPHMPRHCRAPAEHLLVTPRPEEPPCKADISCRSEGQETGQRAGPKQPPFTAHASCPHEGQERQEQ